METQRRDVASLFWVACVYMYVFAMVVRCFRQAVFSLLVCLVHVVCGSLVMMLTVILSQVFWFLSFYVALFLSPRVFAWLLLPHNVSFCYFQLYTCRSFLLCNPFLQYHQCSHTMITCTIDPPLGVLKKVHAVSPVTDVKLSVVAFRYSRPCLCSLDKIYVIRQEKVPTELALIIQSRSFPSPFQQCTIITIHFLVASIAKCNVVYTVRICCISSHLPSSMCHLFFLSDEGQAYCVV